MSEIRLNQNEINAFIKARFIKFLKKKGIEKEFNKNVANGIYNKNLDAFYENHTGNHLRIGYAFNWSDSPQKYTFWGKLESEWNIKCNQYCRMCLKKRIKN